MVSGLYIIISLTSRQLLEKKVAAEGGRPYPRVEPSVSRSGGLLKGNSRTLTFDT